MLRRKWSDTDKRRSGIMVDLIDKQMLERRILRNLERLVGAREPEMDYRLMQRTVSPRLFCLGLKVNHLPPASSCPRFFSDSVTKLTIGQLIDGSSCGRIDMVIKDLDLEPKIDAMMREFLEKRIFKNRTKTKPQTTKPSTEWKRQSQIKAKQSFGHDKEDPHAHIDISTDHFYDEDFRSPEYVVKLCFYHFPVGAARFGLDKDPQAILTWDDLRSKFIHKFFLLLKRQILEMKSRDFSKDLTNRFMKHGTVSMIFLGHAHIMVSWNYINSILSIMLEHQNDQDSLNSAAGGNFLDKMPRECLKIIKSKSKVCISQSKPVVAKVSISTSTSGISPDVSELKEFGQSIAPCNTLYHPKEDLKGITTRSSVAYQGPAIPSTSSSPPKVMNRDTEVTKDTMLPTNNKSIKDIQPPVIQVQSQNPTSEPDDDPVSAPRPNQQTSNPFLQEEMMKAP
ncbi:hypothetical protein Tco_1030773 [Tanacetum coccineum]|uniref:Uncharacterized protein n=1 Tax=Tanacetum coccineum TaxID=301880 RepID=A0ABQ5G905_9ASTR